MTWVVIDWDAEEIVASTSYPMAAEHAKKAYCDDKGMANDGDARYRVTVEEVS